MKNVMDLTPAQRRELFVAAQGSGGAITVFTNRIPAQLLPRNGQGSGDSDGHGFL